MKYDIQGFFKNLSKEFKFCSHMTTITGTLHEELCTLMAMSSLNFLRMRNFWNKICREN